MTFLIIWAYLSLFFLFGALVERYYLSDRSGIGVPPGVAEDWSSPEDGAWDYARSCGMSNCQGACGICEAAS